MKQRRKRMSIIMLALLIGNFFIGNIMPVVQALTSGEVYNYAKGIETNIGVIKEKITASKTNTLYETDNSYKESVLYVESKTNDLEVLLGTKNNILDDGISLSSLITNYFSSKATIYETYFPEDTTVINLNDIADIKYTYYDPENPLILIEATLLTKEEIEGAVNNNYLKDLSDDVANYIDNYDTIINNHQTNYNGVITLIDNKILDLTNKETAINTFYDEEALLGNEPLMTIGTDSILDIISDAKLNLETEKVGITIANITTKTGTVNTIYNNAITSINTFWGNNESWNENGLDTDITTINTEINSIETTLSSIFTSLDDYKNSTISNYTLNNSLVNAFKDIIDFETSYNNLMEDVNEYLERKSSDTTAVHTALTNINEKRVYINQNKILEDITSLVEEADLTDEDVVDVLYGFLDITDLNSTTKEKITNAKLALYPLALVDNSNYQMELSGSNLILNGLLTSLAKADFLINLNYGTFNKEIIETTLYITNSSKLKLYDRNDSLIKEYNIIIKGDVNKDNVVNLDDVIALKDNIKNEVSITSEDLLRIDLNKDSKVDIEDIILLDNLVNSTLPSGTTSNANFVINKTIENDLICYNVVLKTDGIVKGFSFNLTTTDNLIFDNIKNQEPTVDVTNFKALATGNYENDEEIITMCYKEDLEKDLTTESFNLNNIKLVFDNGNTSVINNKSLTSVKVPDKEEAQVTPISNNVIEAEEEPIPLEENNEEKEKEIDKGEEETKQEVATSNVFKIIIIVLLGAVIIYFLNKKDNDEDDPFKEEDTKKATK